MDDILPAEIVKKILEDVDTVEDLNNCRLVNRKWNRLAWEALKPSYTQKLNSFSNDESLLRFLDCYKASIGIPFTKFHFQLDKLSATATQEFATFANQYSLQLEQLSFELGVKLFTTVDGNKLQLMLSLIHASPYLNRLSINGSHKYNQLRPSSFNKVALLPFLPESLPNLRSLQFNRGITTAKESDEDARWFLLNLLHKISPNLKEIVVSTWKNTQVSRVMPVLTLFKDTERIILRKVSFAIYDSSNIEALQVTSYKLTELHLRITYDYHKARRRARRNPYPNRDQVYSTLRSWLEHHSKTLKSLTLLFNNVSHFPLPKLEVLESLDIGLGTYDDDDSDDDDVSDNRPPVLPLNTSELPMLKSVTLNFYNDRWNLFTFGGFVTVESLTIQSYQTASIRTRWENVFPNLKTLELIHLEKYQYERILARTNNLRHLKLEFLTNMGVLIFGPPEELAKLQELENNCRRFPSLQCLASYNQLESLYIKKGGSSTLAEIVKMTQEGLLKRLVNLTFAGQTKMTTDQIEILKSVHGNVSFL